MSKLHWFWRLIGLGFSREVRECRRRDTDRVRMADEKRRALQLEQVKQSQSNILRPPMRPAGGWNPRQT